MTLDISLRTPKGKRPSDLAMHYAFQDLSNLLEWGITEGRIGMHEKHPLAFQDYSANIVEVSDPYKPETA
jgi:hypothetical protein